MVLGNENGIACGPDDLRTPAKIPAYVLELVETAFVNPLFARSFSVRTANLLISVSNSFINHSGGDI